MIRSYPREKDKQSDSTKLNIQEKADSVHKIISKILSIAGIQFG